jgi:hypothetical protein
MLCERCQEREGTVQWGLFKYWESEPANKVHYCDICCFMYYNEPEVVKASRRNLFGEIRSIYYLKLIYDLV